MIEKISYSQLSVYERCPELWYRRYVLGVKEPKSPALQFGEIVHNMLAIFLSSGSLDYSLKVSRDNFSLSKDKDKDLALACNLVRNGVNLLSTHFDSVDYEQRQIEGHLEALLDTLSICYQGYIDFWFRDTFGAIHVVDWKTTSKAYTEHDIATSEQLTGYAWLLWKVLGIQADFIHYISLNKYSGEAQLYTSSRTEQDLAQFESKVTVLAQQMVNEARFKRPEGCMMTWGNKVYACDFYKECWQNKVILPKDNMLKFGS